MPTEISENPVPSPTAMPASPPPAPSTSEWRTYLTDELKADPVVGKWAEKATEKDVPALIKGYANLFTKQGSAIHLPAKDAKPEEVQALRTKLYEAGVFQAPPAKPEEYELTKPETVPAGVYWSDELAGKFASALHKHGVPKSALEDLLPLYTEAVGGAALASKITKEEGMAALKTEFGSAFDERMELATRMSKGIFKTEEEVAFYERIGLANDPRYLGPMLRHAALAAQDSSYVDALPEEGGAMSGEEVREEMARIMSDKTHPMYEGYRRRDPKVEAYVDNLYRKAYGTKKVNMDEGIRI